MCNLIYEFLGVEGGGGGGGGKDFFIMIKVYIEECMYLVIFWNLEMFVNFVLYLRKNLENLLMLWYRGI